MAAILHNGLSSATSAVNSIHLPSRPGVSGLPSKTYPPITVHDNFPALRLMLVFTGMYGYKEHWFFKYIWPVIISTILLAFFGLNVALIAAAESLTDVPLTPSRYWSLVGMIVASLSGFAYRFIVWDYCRVPYTEEDIEGLDGLLNRVFSVPRTRRMHFRHVQKIIARTDLTVRLSFTGFLMFLGLGVVAAFAAGRAFSLRMPILLMAAYVACFVVAAFVLITGGILLYCVAYCFHVATDNLKLQLRELMLREVVSKFQILMALVEVHTFAWSFHLVPVLAGFFISVLCYTVGFAAEPPSSGNFEVSLIKLFDMLLISFQMGAIAVIYYITAGVTRKFNSVHKEVQLIGAEVLRREQAREQEEIDNKHSSILQLGRKSSKAVTPAKSVQSQAADARMRRLLVRRETAAMIVAQEAMQDDMDDPDARIPVKSSFKQWAHAMSVYGFERPHWSIMGTPVTFNVVLRLGVAICSLMAIAVRVVFP